VVRPGIAKARALPLVRSRNAVLVRAEDARWRELFERADIVSEGSVRDEAREGRPARAWYGSTSLILPAEGEAEIALAAAVAERDLHVRLRALRTARREACLRAPARLGRLSCEIRVSADPRGVRIDVDVQAPLIEGRRRRSNTAAP
jgi:hypothetical protein